MVFVGAISLFVKTNTKRGSKVQCTIKFRKAKKKKKTIPQTWNMPNGHITRKKEVYQNLLSSHPRRYLSFEDSNRQKNVNPFRELHETF